MIQPSRTSIALALTALLAFTATALAGKFNKTLSIGDAAPEWAGLPGVDGKQHSLADYKSAKVVVVLFTCNHCPVASGYEDRLIALQKDFQDQGLQLVAINVNTNDADKLDKMKERATGKGYNYPYLYDESQKSAVGYGASVTPQAFVLDGNRKVVYMGAIDDNFQPSEVKRPYVRDAVAAVLGGKQPEIQETRQLGCGIEYQK